MSNALRKIIVAALAGASVWVLMWPRLMSWPDHSTYGAVAWAMVIVALIIQGWALDAMEVGRRRRGT
jgi:NhaP-type Na+/H+ and K+/H+ antiporter